LPEHSRIAAGLPEDVVLKAAELAEPWNSEQQQWTWIATEQF
jgi:hypothetical protein